MLPIQLMQEVKIGSHRSPCLMIKKYHANFGGNGMNSYDARAASVKHINTKEKWKADIWLISQVTMPHHHQKCWISWVSIYTQFLVLVYTLTAPKRIRINCVRIFHHQISWFRILPSLESLGPLGLRIASPQQGALFLESLLNGPFTLYCVYVIIEMWFTCTLNNWFKRILVNWISNLKIKKKK